MRWKRVRRLQTILANVLCGFGSAPEFPGRFGWQGVISARWWRGRSVIGRVILQELVHGLQGLIIPIDDLQILNSCRCLDGLRMEYMGDGKSGAPTDRQDQGKRSSERRAKLAAGREEKRTPKALKEALRLCCLLFPQSRMEAPVKPRAQFRCRPAVKQGEGRLQLPQFLLTGRAGLEMGLSGESLLRAWVQKEVGQCGLAVCAVHSGNPFFPLGGADPFGVC